MPTALRFASHPASVVAGLVISPAIEVQVVDDTGAVSDTSTANVTLTLGSPSAGLTGHATVRALNGIARFTDLAIGKAAASYVVTASAPGLRTADAVIAVTPSAPRSLVFRSLPSLIAAGQRIMPAPIVEIWDAEGNVVTTAVDPVTLSLATNPDGAIVAGTTTVTAVSGIASFDEITIDRTSQSLAFRATSGTLTPAVSTAFRAVPATVDTPMAVPGGIAFTQLGGGGDDHRCGLIADGSAFCWGLNDQGQLGNGSTTASTSPVPVAGNLHFKAISAGSGFSCAIATDGRSYCWGGPGRGTPRVVDSTMSFISIDASGSVCGLTATGRVYCGVPFQPAFADSVPAFTAMIETPARTCGLTVAGAVYCNDGFFTGDSYRWDLPEPESQGTAFATLTGDSYHNCGLISDGSAFCWGQNEPNIFASQTAGELGIGTPWSQSKPAAVVGGHRFVSLSAGFGHTCGVTTAGETWCWGTNAVAELGTTAAPDGQTEGGTPYMLSPVLVAGGHRFATVYAGWGHTCALTPAGEAWCWGSNHEGELWQTPAGLRYLAMLKTMGLRRFSLPQ